MGQELVATALQVGDQVIPLADLLRVTEAARVIGCSVATVNKHIYFSPKLRSVVAGTSRFVFRDECEALRREMEAEARDGNLATAGAVQ